MIPYDGASGGTESTTIDASGGLTWFKIILIDDFDAVEDFCFIPTASALDLNDVGQSSLNHPYTNGISPNNPSTFANFVTEVPAFAIDRQRNNLPHIRFTARNAEWMFNEMEGNTPITSTVPQYVRLLYLSMDLILSAIQALFSTA
jgi:hypothetical protein